MLSHAYGRNREILFSLPIRSRSPFVSSRHACGLTLPGGVAFASPSLHSRFSEHSNALFLDAAAGLIRYSGRNDDRTATSSSSASSLLGVLVFSVMLPNLLVITSTDMIALVLNHRKRVTNDDDDDDNGTASGRVYIIICACITYTIACVYTPPVLPTHHSRGDRATFPSCPRSCNIVHLRSMRYSNDVRRGAV